MWSRDQRVNGPTVVATANLQHVGVDFGHPRQGNAEYLVVQEQQAGKAYLWVEVATSRSLDSQLRKASTSVEDECESREIRIDQTAHDAARSKQRPAANWHMITWNPTANQPRCSACKPSSSSTFLRTPQWTLAGIHLIRPSACSGA